MQIKHIIYCFLVIFYSASCSNNEDISIKNENENKFSAEIMIDSNSIDFFVISDWGENANENQNAVAKSMGNLCKSVLPDFIITGGDNFQTDGIQSIDDEKWQSDFENVYNYPGLNVKWYATLGNHDYLGNPASEIAYSMQSEKWCMPSNYYTFVYKYSHQSSVRFVVLDTPGLIDEYNSVYDTISISCKNELDWFENILLNNKEKWVIVVGHHTIFSSGLYHGNTPEMIKTIYPILEKYKVDLYISGHDHDFEHIRFDNKTTQYIITGTGSDTRLIEPNYFTQFCVSTLGFSYFNLTDSCITFQFVDSENNILYKNYIKK